MHLKLLGQRSRHMYIYPINYRWLLHTTPRNWTTKSAPGVQNHVNFLQGFFPFISLKIPSLNTYSYKKSDLICPAPSSPVQDIPKQDQQKAPNTTKGSERNPAILWLQRSSLHQGTGCRTPTIVSFFPLGPHIIKQTAFSVQGYLMFSFIKWMMNNILAKFCSYLGRAVSILGSRVRIKKSRAKWLTAELKLGV